MIVYRVFPWLPSAAPGAVGHPTYVHAAQNSGRWDNADRYAAFYCAATADGAVGETFAHLSRWSAAMLPFPALPGARRALGIYEIDEERHPILDLDDPKALMARALRPSEVVMRNRPHSQAIALAIFEERTWSGIGWWSMHRPQWALRVLFGTAAVTTIDVQPLTGSAAIASAGRLLAKVVDPDLQ